MRNKVSKSIGIICKIRKDKPCSILWNLYFTLVHPLFEYCNIFSGLYIDLCRLKTFRKQKKAIRIVTNCKGNSHTTPLFAKLSVLTLYHKNNYRTYCFMYRMHIY